MKILCNMETDTEREKPVGVGLVSDSLFTAS